MDAVVKIKEVVCDKCGRIFKETRRRYYCEHCKRYYHVCNHCKEKIPRCSHCGILLVKQTEPMNKLHKHLFY